MEQLLIFTAARVHLHALDKLEKGSDKTHHSIRTEADSRAHWDHLQSTVISIVFVSMPLLHDQDVSNTPPQGLSVPMDLLLNDERKEKEEEEEEEDEEEKRNDKKGGRGRRRRRRGG